MYIIDVLWCVMSPFPEEPEFVFKQEVSNKFCFTRQSPPERIIKIYIYRGKLVTKQFQGSGIPSNLLSRKTGPSPHHPGIFLWWVWLPSACNGEAYLD